MNDQTELFIKIVRKYTYLYDTSHEHYKNVLKKAEAWNEIAEEFNMTSDAAKAKWKNLRDSYLRFKKSAAGETGLARKYSRWPWSKHMSFLDATMQYPSQSNNVTEPIMVIEEEPHLSHFLSSALISTSPLNDELNNLPASPEIAPPSPTKKKRKSLSEAREYIDSSDLSEIDKVINFLHDRKSQEQKLDGVDHLFLSYAATFKTFRPTTQAKLKLKLATLFSETELSELKDQELS